MAICTKTARTIQASATNTAGSTTTATGLDVTSKFGGLAVLTVVNGGTGPTVGCTATLQTSRDNTNWADYAVATAGTTASATYTFNVEVPPSVMYIRSVFTGNTAQSVTVECEFQELTSIG